MINTFFNFQKNKLNIKKISKLLFFAAVVILQNTINFKLNRSYAYDVTCTYVGPVCADMNTPPSCATGDNGCSHTYYVKFGICPTNPTKAYWYKFICPEDCWGYLSPTCEPSGGGGGGGGEPVVPGCTEDNCWGTYCNCCVVGNTFCADNCTEIPPSIGIGTCSDGRHLCKITSCGVCNGPCTSTSDPKGAFDGASCSPTGVISGYGWTCDKDNYSTSLTANIYKGNASTENLIASVTANIPAESAVGLACGGDPNNVNHRFNFSTSPITFSPGTYTIKAYGVNIGGGSDAELPSSRTVTCPICTPVVDGGLSDWGTCSAACEEYDTQLATCTDPAPSCGGSDCSAECTAIGGDTYIKNLGHCLKDCYGGPCCTPNQGTLSNWGECENGKQTRTCDGATCCGTDCGNCNGDPLVRDCLYMEGNIWNDELTTGTMMSNEIWRGDAGLACDSSRYFGNFSLSISEFTGNQIKSWWCSSLNRAYYRTTASNGGLPVDGDRNIKPESTLSSVSLSSTSLPPGYECDSWDYQNYLNSNEKQGTGCTATNLIMPASGWTNVHFKLKCQATQWGDWGDCVGGVQTRTCSNPDPVCQAKYCLGSSTRPCLRIDGNIWSDDDKNGISISDYWKKDSNSPSGCSTNKTFSDFVMTISGETTPSLNQISDWWCHPSGYGVYFNTPVPNAIEPESTKTASLTNIPAGYDVLSWRYRYLKDGIITSQTGLGGVTSNLLMPPYANWVNLHWELEQQTYNLTINVKKIKPEITDLPGSCGDSDIYDGPLADASITVRDRDDNTVVCSGSSNSGGDLVCPVWILQGPLNIEATKTIGGATPETYELRCPNSTVYEYDPGSVNDGDNKSVGIGLKVNYKDGWVSAIDSDIFANLLSVVVPEGPTDNSDTNQTPQGFAKTLINSSVNDEKHLGFIFSEVNDRSNPNVDTECPNSKGFETTDVQCTNLGGFSYNLISGGEHDSKWLESFTFKAPENSLDYIPKSTSFKSGEIYNIGIGSGEGDILPTSYSITDGDSVAILYIDGNLTINNNFTTNSSGRLLLVVNGSVTISKDVGTDVGSFLLSQDPNIEAGIVASGGIYFNSIGGLVEEGNNDKPIMVSAPLISKESLTFARDLYHDNNAIMPAESAKSFNKYLYLLSSLEREKSQDNLYFTGLTTYDLDWEYIY